jgi:UDP-glucuronate decarboxylase
LPQEDPKRRQPDIEKARRILNWEPTVALRDGVEKTITYFSETVTAS